MRVALLLIAALLLVWLLHSGPSPAGPPPAHAAVLASVETTSCPAPERVVKLALGKYRAAKHARAEWARAKSCLGERARLRVAGRPDRDAAAAVWLAAMERWQDQRRDFSRRTGLLVARMTSTKGGGALRWKPLVLWVWRCSDSLAYLMCHIAWHESSGSPFKWNTAGSGAFGIWQLLPKPHGVWGPMSQAKAALRKFRDAVRWWGNGLLPWRGCRAFTCPGGCGLY